MERRVALKSMAVAMGAMAGLPAWASGWNKTALAGTRFLAATQAETLALAVEAIIPKTDTPGAGELGVDKFVQKMITDCYNKDVQNNFTKGLEAVEAQSQKAFGKSFAAISTEQKLQLLGQLEKSKDSAEKSFFGLLKNLTIQGYMNSEYVMTNITHYEMVPARYHGCVPVVKG